MIYHKLIEWWYQPTKNKWLCLLLPFSWVFNCIIHCRYFLYKKKIFSSYIVSAPVIVIGNITVGGTGKTPLVLYLVERFKAQGFKPGIISRGVGASLHKIPHLVTSFDRPETVGDEALLLARKARVPTVVCKNRVLAAQFAIANCDCNLIIADDGLQHYQLQRDLEIVVIDGERGLGNQCLLPAGPLRESVSRLNTVNFIVINGQKKCLDIKSYHMSLIAQKAISLHYKEEILLHDFPIKRIHAVAGIGHPERFFKLLNTFGFKIIAHIFKDHHLYTEEDLSFAEDLPILMTEKDAIKCQGFTDKNIWVVPVKVDLAENFFNDILNKLYPLTLRS